MSRTALQSNTSLPRLRVGRLGGFFLLLVLALLGCKRKPTNTPPILQGNGGAELSSAEATDLIRLAQRANGYLENLQLPEAANLLEEIIAKSPGEALGPRNLAICHYLLYQQEKLSRSDVETSLQRLQQVEPQEPSTFWLMGKTATKTDPDRAVRHLRQALELDATDAAYAYEAYDAARASASSQTLAPDLLVKAHELAPNNLFILGDLLVSQAERQDEGIETTLKLAESTLAPLRDVVLQRTRADLAELVTTARESAAQREWSTVLRTVRVMNNVTRPHDFTQSDKRAIQPHALEFMVHRFSDEFLAKYAQPIRANPLNDVKFTRLGTDQQPPAVEKPRDAVLVDVDLDGRLDLVVLSQNRLSVLARAKDSTSWATMASIDLADQYDRILAADLDRDRNIAIAQQSSDGDTSGCFEADPDIVLFGESGLLMVRNASHADGKRNLEIVEQRESIAKLSGVRNAILVDFDHDSNLDLVAATDNGVAAVLALGNMVFEDVTEFSTLGELSRLPINSLVAVDWDRDVDIDIVAVAGQKIAGYLENLRHGNFRWQEFDWTDRASTGVTAISVIEADGNVSWDVVGGGESGLSLVQTRTPWPGTVQLLENKQLAESAVHELLTCDYDNNGYQDVIAWGQAGISAWRGGPDATFSAQEQLVGDVQGITRCDVGDVDNDGDLDLCVIHSGGVSLYANEGGNTNNWLAIRAMGQADNAGKANHHGIGSLIEVKSGPVYQAQIVSRPVTHFGLGREEAAAIVRFLWTNGVPQDQLDAVANQAMCELMVLKGSCPYIYTWTGKRYEFFTDCLWAAPIGLQLAEDVLAPTRSWEYLKIPGDRLAQREGKYWLQVTEELWEAGYFDYVRLIAVDHPAGIEVFSNEKVGPAEISGFKLHTVSHRRYPLSARDQRGRDVLPAIRERDGNFLRAFDRTLAPGLAEDHFLELDLGPLDAPAQVTLFLTGWIYPTDTSMNVALSRHPLTSGPRPPAVFVPNAEGEWEEVQAYMGFPGGKTKTIAVDLSNVFLTDDYRVRISTTAEIYWDEAFFTVDEKPASLELEELQLASAELHYRGFSAPLPKQSYAPEQYDYAQLLDADRWPPMRGAFTRYGDVHELLARADDRSVVLGAGDEMTISFFAPTTPPPDGWARDFIMHNVGWDKDADLNTIYGQTVEPLPYRDMPSYPYGLEGSFPETDLHQEYLQRYQTRFQQSGAFWRRIKGYASERARVAPVRKQAARDPRR